MRLVGSCIYVGTSDVGVGGAGGRFTYNFNRYFALDTEANASIYVGDETIGVNGALVFAGVKVGRRFNKVGVFAKARPGFTSRFTRQTGPSFRDSERVTYPALDLGMVLEYYPSKHSVVRFDASDVIIGFGNDPQAPPFGEHRKLRFPVRKVFFTGSRERDSETLFLPK